MPVAAVVKDLETEDLMDLVRYLATQLKKEGVTIRLNKAVTPEVVRAERPDVLVIAAGAAHTKLDLPGAADGPTSRKVIKTERLHSRLQLALKLFSPRRLERLTRLWMPVGKSAVIMGGTLHGCELAEFLVKRKRKVVIAHDGPASELGNGMTIDDLENLWPWFKLKHVPIWSEVQYREIVNAGLKVQVPDKRVFVLEGKDLMTTQDWGANTETIAGLAPLVEETHVIGSCREPGWIVDAIREGALTGYAI